MVVQLDPLEQLIALDTFITRSTKRFRIRDASHFLSLLAHMPYLEDVSPATASALNAYRAGMITAAMLPIRVHGVDEFEGIVIQPTNALAQRSLRHYNDAVRDLERFAPTCSYEYMMPGSSRCEAFHVTAHHVTYPSYHRGTYILMKSKERSNRCIVGYLCGFVASENNLLFE